MKSLIILVLSLIYFVSCDQLAVYWGQDPAGGDHYTLEKSISEYCEKFEYDIIPVAFLDFFFYAFNKDSYPSINLANHCNKTFDGYPGLLNCPLVADAIQTCQKKGKTIILSMGGAAGIYGFSTASQATAFAKTIWNLFLGGTSSVRPFGNVILDGLDFDIEAGSTTYYADFIRTIRDLMNTDINKRYIITGAPQCPYPDVVMGPGLSGTVLTDIPEEFDYLFVQFYNNYCYLGNEKSFEASISNWFEFAEKTKTAHAGKGPLIFIGLPSHPRASSGSYYYQTPAQVKAAYEKLQGNANLGGIMLWDASFDMNNVISGRPYSSHLADFLKTQPKATTCYFQEEFPFMPRWSLVLLGAFVLLVCLLALIVRKKGVKKEKKMKSMEQCDLLNDLYGNFEKKVEI